MIIAQEPFQGNSPASPCACVVAGVRARLDADETLAAIIVALGKAADTARHAGDLDTMRTCIRAAAHVAEYRRDLYEKRGAA